MMVHIHVSTPNHFPQPWSQFRLFESHLNPTLTSRPYIEIVFLFQKLYMYLNKVKDFS